MSKTFRIRYRIDGVMTEMKSPPKRLQASIISRLKIQANMSIAERRIPQDGRIQSNVGTKLIDFARVLSADQSRRKHCEYVFSIKGFAFGLAGIGIFHG